MNGRREPAIAASEGGNLVPAILFAVPALGGAICAVVFCCARRFLPRWRVLGWLASFVAAAGIGAGMAATAMHARGIRIAALQWLYEAPWRGYRRTIQTLRQPEAPITPDTTRKATK